jgi:undecaprenyl-diphosphatase
MERIKPVYLITAFLFLILVAELFPVFFIDVVFTNFLQEINFVWFNQLMLNITRLGDVMIGYLSVLAAFLILASFKKIRAAFFVIISVSSAVFLSEFFKFLVHRPRPSAQVVEKILDISGNNSFPSGHVMFAVGFYGFLIILVNQFIKNVKIRNILTIIFFTIIVLMGFSRIYLGVHWLSDVIGAYFLGVAWLLTTRMIYLKK